MEQNIKAIIQALESKHPEAILAKEQLYDIPSIEVTKTSLFSLILDLKENHGFNFLTDLTVVHYPDNEDRELCGTYLMHNWVQNIRLRIKTYISQEDNTLPSMVELYKAANWLEREAYDNFGVIYENHPDLRRILNMDEMDYHPLLKQYALEDESRQDKDDTFFGR